jgi:hypothetical protein
MKYRDRRRIARVAGRLNEMKHVIEEILSDQQDAPDPAYQPLVNRQMDALDDALGGINTAVSALSNTVLYLEEPR